MAELSIIDSFLSAAALKEMDITEKRINSIVEKMGKATFKFASTGEGANEMAEYVKKLGEAEAKMGELQGKYDALNEKKAKAVKLTIEEKEALKEENMVKKLNVQLNSAQAGSFNALSAQYRLNTIELNKLSATQKANDPIAKKLIADTKAMRDQMISMKEATSDHTLKVGRYTDALGQMPGTLGRAANGVKGLGAQFKLLLANPVVLIIAGITAAVAGLFAIFKSTDTGAVAFAGALRAIKNVADIVIDRLVSFAKLIGSILTADWEGIKKNGKDAFGGVAESLRDAAKAGYEYEQQMDSIDDRQKASLLPIAKLKNEIADLREISKDQTKDTYTRMRALDSALAKERQVFEIEKGFAKERLFTGEQELASKILGTNKSVSARRLMLVKWLSYDQNEIESMKEKDKVFGDFYDKNEEAFQGLQQQSAEYVGMEGEFVSSLRRMKSERSGFVKDIQSEKKELAELRIEGLKQAEQTQKIGRAWADWKDAIKDVSDSLAKVEPSQTEKTLKEHEKFVTDSMERLKKANKEYQKEIIDADNAESQKRTKNRQERDRAYIEKGFEIATEAASTITDILNEKLEQQSEKLESEEAKRLKVLEDNRKAGLLTEEQYQSEVLAVKNDYQGRQNELDKKQRENEKISFLFKQAQAIAQIWLDYTKAVGATGFNPLLQPLLLGEAIAMTGLAAAQTIPYFANGGVMGFDGLGVVGDANKNEVIKTPTGDLFLTPSTPTLVKMDKGTIIYPDADKYAKTIHNEQTVQNITDMREVNKNLRTLIAISGGKGRISLHEQSKIQKRLN